MSGQEFTGGGANAIDIVRFIPGITFGFFHCSVGR
jgi:hypothetical protein